jgi:hypothetical protein
MRYSLLTLLFLITVGPPLLATAWMYRDWLLLRELWTFHFAAGVCFALLYPAAVLQLSRMMKRFKWPPMSKRLSRLEAVGIALAILAACNAAVFVLSGRTERELGRQRQLLITKAAQQRTVQQRTAQRVAPQAQQLSGVALQAQLRAQARMKAAAQPEILLTRVYTTALDAVVADKRVIARLGDPVEPDIESDKLFRRERTGMMTSEDETFEYDISGPKGKAVVRVVSSGGAVPSTGRRGLWLAKEITVKLNDGTTIDVPSPVVPGSSRRATTR